MYPRRSGLCDLTHLHVSLSLVLPHEQEADDAG
jgi:hypothetical protein